MHTKCALIFAAGLMSWMTGCSNDSKDTASDRPGPQGDSVTDDTADTDASSDDSGDTDQSTDDTGTSTPEPTYGLSTQSLVHDEEKREYLLYVPESYDGTTAVPVMMNFHGFGGTANGQMQTSDMRQLAESENFILVYPQGTLLDGETHWNTYLPGKDNKSDADDFGFVDVMLDELSANYAIDAERVYATGYSNGGDFTYTLACFVSDRVTGIAPVSGLMWVGTERDCTTTHPTAAIIFHGTEDSARPYDGWDGYLLSIDDALAYWAGQNSITDSPTVTSLKGGMLSVERYDYAGGKGDVTMRHYKVIGGGHVWFSISDEGVDTNQLIWNYLSQFDQNGLR